jgi:hypothetical protein
MEDFPKHLAPAQTQAKTYKTVSFGGFICLSEKTG